MQGKRLDLKGKVFGQWTVIKRNDSCKGKTQWVCICSCGNISNITGSELTRGRTSMCKFCASKKTIKRNMTHGMSKSPEYNSWRGMIDRCKNPNHSSYKTYGGKGINVCKDWELFENFYRDMGPRPKGTSIDRINGNAGYCKENCEWRTQKQQNNNRKSNRLFEFNGNQMTIMQISEATGMAYDKLNNRLVNLKWSIQKILEKESKNGKIA